MAAVLVTLSYMELPVKYEHFNFSVLQQVFKNCGHNQKVLVYILSIARQILSCVSNTLLYVKSSLAHQI